ncbi:hypothetical protein JTB14_003503 [Gonioctena quinquepunctata]|nr:hypothetical protein JTB14_003503 [Gonioctena quinquepunctata]
MDWTTQNSPNRNLVLSEISSSASSTTRFSEVMTIETSKKRSPSSSTSSAPEKVDAMRNLDADLFKMRSPASSTTSTASETINLNADLFKMRSPASSTTSTAAPEMVDAMKN